MDWRSTTKNQSVYRSTKTPANDLKNGRTFSGPSEKKQYYINQFTHLVQKRDPHNKFLTKIDLNETDKAIRKMLTTNLRMYKFVQIIVDDCVLLENDVLELISSFPVGESPRCSENSIQKMSVHVEKQRRFLNLARFNQDRWIKMEKATAPLEDSLSETNMTTGLDSLRNQTEINYFNSIASNNLPIVKPSVVIIAKALENFCKMMHQNESFFKTKLIDTDQMLALSFFSNLNNVQSLEELFDAELFEKDSPCKTRLIILCSLLVEFSNVLSQFKEHVDAHQARGRIVACLNQIKRRQDELFQEMMMSTGGTVNKRAQLSKDFELLVRFVEHNMSHLRPDLYFNRLFELQKSVILLGTE